MSNKNLIAAQMATAAKVLKQLNTDEFEAVCVGGAPRDWWMGKPANDIDICVVRKPVKFDPGNMVARQPPCEEVNAHIAACGFETSRTVHREDTVAARGKKEEEYLLNMALHAVHDLKVDGFKVQLLVIEVSVFAYVAAFSASICKITYANRQYRASGEFLLSLLTKSIVISSQLQINGQAVLCPYLEKLAGYFPDYKFCTTWAQPLSETGVAPMFLGEWREVHVDSYLVRCVKRWYNAMREFINY